MKKTLLLFITLFPSIIGFSQTEIGVSFGSSLATKKPGNVDVQSSFNAFFYIHREIQLAPKLILEPTFNLGSSTYFIDGNFSQDANGKNMFGITPSNYKQNRLNLISIRIPLLLKYEIFWSQSGEGVSIGAGPYLEYLISKKQLFKIDETNYSQKAPIDNSLLGGVAFDFGTSGKVFKIIILDLEADCNIS